MLLFCGARHGPSHFRYPVVARYMGIYCFGNRVVDALSKLNSPGPVAEFFIVCGVVSYKYSLSECPLEGSVEGYATLFACPACQGNIHEEGIIGIRLAFYA